MRKSLLTLLLITVALLLSVPVAQATPPQAANGTFAVVNVTPTSVQPVSDNCQIELEATFSFQGTLDGSFTAHFSILHHGACDQPAPEIFEAQGTYTGMVNDASGSFDFNFHGNIDAQGRAQGQLVIQRGTAGLANLHGQLTLTGQAGVGGTYTGNIHFEP